MTYTTCNTCNQRYFWRWEEAFDKFGFNDGDDQIETETVINALEAAGYSCETDRWGLHNIVITSIKGADGEELIPATANVGYDEPRDYLPSELVGLLDRALPEDGEIVS